MKHYSQLTETERARLFRCEPEPISRTSPREELAASLGATLYCPATRPDLAGDVLAQGRRGFTSIVLCLEDAIAEADLPRATSNLVGALQRLSATASSQLPAVFVRVRTPGQIHELAKRCGPSLGVLTGFVAPKFTPSSGAAYLQALTDVAGNHELPMYLMPVLESPEIAYQEARRETLLQLRALLACYREQVLAVRIGATDLCGLFGLRRNRDHTIYDIQVLATIIADIINILGRPDGTGFIITGGVWEYFHTGERLLKPMLRSTPFAGDRQRLREQLLAYDLDGLLREVLLDRENGLLGKTVIHPSHLQPVHALHVVSAEEYDDARDVAGAAGAKAQASQYANKMNEIGPHDSWASRTLLRARVFGVAAPEVTPVDLLTAGSPA